MRTVVLWAYVAVAVLGTLSCIPIIGQPRKPLSAGVACTVVLFHGLLLAGLVRYVW